MSIVSKIGQWQNLTYVIGTPLVIESLILGDMVTENTAFGLADGRPTARGPSL